MRREVILLVAGLAAVAALPVQESAASSLQSDLLSIILGANPEENDLATEHNDNLLAGREEQTSHSQEAKEQPQPQSQPQDPPQEQEQTQPQDPPQEQQQTQPQDPPQEQPQTQPQDASQEQPKQQGSEMKSVEESLLSEGSDERLEDSNPEAPEARPEPQPKLVNPQDFSYRSEELDDETANFDPVVEALPLEPDDKYVVLEVNKETPSLDSGGTFVYKAQNEPMPFDQYDYEEPQMEPLLHDYEQEPLSFEPKMDSFPPAPEESQLQMNPLPYDLREPLSPEEPLSSDPQMDSFLLNKEPLESDYEELPLRIKEGPDAQYDYRSSVEADQSDLEDMSSEPGVPAEDSYHAAQDVTPVNLFSWLIPDFLDEEPTDYDELPHTSSYHNEAMVIDDGLPINPEVHYDPQVLEGMNQEEPSGSEVNEAAAPSDDSLLGGVDDVVVVGKPVPLIVGLKDGADDVSLADFFIPTYDASTYSSASQEYSSNGTPEDGSQELVSSDDGTYSVDDGLVRVGPTLRIDMVDEEQDQPDTMTFGGFLFPENNPFEDGRSIVPWSTENDEADQREYPEKDTEITILESQPMYIPNKGINKPHPILLKFQDKETDESDEPWNNPKSLMIDFIPDADTEDEESLPMEENDLSSSLDNNNMDIIVIQESGETFDDFPTSPLIGGPAVTRGQSIPFTQYPEDQRQSPYWVPQRIPDQQVPKVYFSVADELPRRKPPTFFEHLNEDLSFSTPISHRRLQAPVMRDPFTFMNEITEDDMPPQFLASPSTLSQFRFMGPDTSSSPRNYQNSFETPRFPFRDLLRRLNPSSVQSPPLYHPQSYNSFPHYTSPLVPYSWPSDYSIETDYSPVQNYYPDRPQRLSYESNDVPSGIFREDTMSDLYSDRPQRHFSDYTADVPFMSTDSFTSPHPRFPFLQRPRYAGNSPSYNKPQYSQNRFYSTGPYHPTPIYPIYAPEYYGI